MIRTWFDAARATTAAAGLAVTIQAGPPPTLTILEPADGSYISGVTLMQAVTTPATLRVERVTFYVDGRVACALDRRPFECRWDAGPGIKEHQIRVVAQLPGGDQLVRTLRTRGVAFTETVDVDAVQVTVSVTDDHQGFVRNLPRERFKVYEDGKLQTITSFGDENIPLELTVAVDVSGSMTEAMPQVRASVKKFLRALRPQDSVTLLAFNDNIFTIARPTATLEDRLQAVDKLAPWGGTSFYEVIIRAIDAQSRQTGRRAVVVFTDGEDRNSHVALTTAEQRVGASDSLVYVIGLGQGAKVPALKQIIEKLATVSGGRAFFADNADRLDQPFAAIVEELANQYLLGYTSTNSAKDGTWRVIKIDVSGNRLKVRGRQGYLAVSRKEGAR
jgi:Ca-activated chloride channel homolog